LELDGEAVHREAGFGGAFLDRVGDAPVVDLDGSAAVGADQELADMPVFRMVAADEGVEALDPVDQALFHQEVEGAIDRRRGGCLIPLTQIVQDRIGPDRPVAVPDQFQHSPAERGQSGPTLGANCFGQTEGIRDASGVVVRGGGLERVGVQGGSPSGQTVANIAIIAVRHVRRDGVQCNPVSSFIYFTLKCEIQRFVGNDLDLKGSEYVFERTGKLLDRRYWQSICVN